MHYGQQTVSSEKGMFMVQRGIYLVHEDPVYDARGLCFQAG